MGVETWTEHGYQLAKAIEWIRQGEALLEQEQLAFLMFTSKETISGNNWGDTPQL